jgi:aryl-alcohol dehydrogenase-like predicted oxidoreductase
LHWPDSTGVPIEETWGAVSELQDAGKVRFIGVSNFDRELIERCAAISHVDSLQQEFSMLALDDRDLIRWCGDQGTGVVAYGPLGFGLLTGKISREHALSVSDWRRTEDGPFTPEKLDHDLAIVEELRPIAARLRITMAQLALAWNVAQPGVTSAIAGSRDPDHARDNAAAGDVELDQRTLAEIEEILTA